MDVAILFGVFSACDVAAEKVRPAAYRLFAIEKSFQPHSAEMYDMLPVAAGLHVIFLAITGFYVWHWWTPLRLAGGALIVMVLFGLSYSGAIFFLQRLSYPQLHLIFMAPSLAIAVWAVRLFITALPGFRTMVDRRYPVIEAAGPTPSPSANNPITGRKISILTVHYQEPEMWESFQRRLSQNPPSTNFELIVANNSPSDRLEIAPELAPYTTILPLKNPGFARGVNEVFTRASGDVLGVFNLDVELTGEVIDRGVGRLVSNEEAGVLLPRLNHPDGQRQKSVRRFYDWRSALYARFPLRPMLPTPGFFRHYLMEDASPEAPISVDWGLGAAMFIRRESIESDHIFDPRYFLYFEDVDLCWNMWRRNWQVLYDPDLVCVHHHKRSSAKGPHRSQLYHHITSFLMFAAKHGGLRRPDRKPASRAS
jgi:GT2 family glycosyltransferase